MAYFGQIVQLLKLLSKAAWGFVLYKSGRDAAKNKHMEKDIEQRNEASDARNRIANDPALADRVRKRWTRK